MHAYMYIAQMYVRIYLESVVVLELKIHTHTHTHKAVVQIHTRHVTHTCASRDTYMYVT